MLSLVPRVLRIRSLTALRQLTSVQWETARTYSVGPSVERTMETLYCRRHCRWLQQQGRQEEVASDYPKISSEAQMLFEDVWNRIEQKYGQDLVIPREIVWLNGAPGSGKGANTPFILRSRGLGRSISISELLAASPAAHSYMKKGELIPEDIVFEALLSEVFDPIRDDGIGMIIDGYPRTPTQVDSLKLLHDKLLQLYNEKRDASPGVVIPKPSFKVVVLYVDETTSLKRQQKRGIVQTQKTQRAHDAGADDPNAFGDIRATDLNVEHCKKRYAIFKAHYATLLRLKSFFPFHLIDAMGSLDDTRRQILRELRYQSSTDLEEVTYDAIRHLPMAKELSKICRQQLTSRLDTYAQSHTALFHKVIEIIDRSVLPILRRSGMAGEAIFTCSELEMKSLSKLEYGRATAALFSSNPLAIDILTDVLSDRGYHVSYSQRTTHLPVKLDLQTGEIVRQSYRTHHFKIVFVVSSVRDLGDGEIPFSTGGGSTTRALSDMSDIAVSFMPEGTDHQAKYKGKDAREALIAESLSHDLEYQQEGLSEMPSVKTQDAPESETLTPKEHDPSNAFIRSEVSAHKESDTDKG